MRSRPARRRRPHNPARSSSSPGSHPTLSLPPAPPSPARHLKPQGGIRKESQSPHAATNVVVPVQRASPDRHARCEPLLSRLHARSVGYGRHARRGTHKIPAQPRNAKGPEMFSSMRHVLACDMSPYLAPAELMERAVGRLAVSDIVVAGEFVLSLLTSGTCFVFKRVSKEFFGVLNPPEFGLAVRSVFFNRATDCVLTVSVQRHDRRATGGPLQCHSVPLCSIRAKRFEWRRRVLETEHLVHPGFVELDDLNGKILTCSRPPQSKANIYKVWDLATFRLLHQLQAVEIQEVKISLGVLLVIFERSRTALPVRVLDISTGRVVAQLCPLLKQGVKVELVELFHDKLLLKQVQEPLRLIDVKRQGVPEITVPCAKFPTPSSILSLFDKNVFLTFHERKVVGWDANGNDVIHFEDNDLHYPGKPTTNVCVTRKQDLMFSFCFSQQLAQGTLNVAAVPSGQCLHKLTTASVSPVIVPDSAYHPLHQVFSLCYDEDANEVYTGGVNAMLHVWGCSSA